MKIFPPNKKVATAFLWLLLTSCHCFFAQKTWAKSTQGAALISPFWRKEKRDSRLRRLFGMTGKSKKKTSKMTNF